MHCDLTSWVKAVLQVRDSSVQVTPGVHCPTDHQMVEIRSRLGLRLCFHPHATPFSVAVSPQVVFLVGFRKSGVGVTLLVAAMRAGMPCLQECLPKHCRASCIHTDGPSEPPNWGRT